MQLPGILYVIPGRTSDKDRCIVPLKLIFTIKKRGEMLSK